MSILESIIQDLREMPLRKLVDVARFIHSISDTAERRRAEVLKRTHGCLGEEEGEAFENAVADCRRVTHGS